MSTDTITKPGSSTAFPAKDVEATLRVELLGVVAGTAAMDGITLPSDTKARSAFAIQIDSLDVVDVLVAVEKIVGFELKDHIVKAGGYGSVDAALAHVVPRIELAWQKNGKKGSKK